jgi:hypothetical protein
LHKDRWHTHSAVQIKSFFHRFFHGLFGQAA